MLNYLSGFESVQNMFVFGIFVLLGILAIGATARRMMLVKDVEAENEMRRKIQWHNIENQKVIEGQRAKAREAEGE